MDAPSNGQFSPGTEQPPGSSFAPRSSGGKGNKLPSANKKRNSDQLGQLHRQSPIYKSIGK